jgi:hypothetical protein
MLTAEKIKTIPALASLADDAITALVTLSQNDEAATIAAKVAEIHNAYDADIKAVTGQDKPAGVKTYEHMKAMLTAYKTQAETGAAELAGKVQALEVERADLQKKIKEGATDAALKTQVDALTAAIADEKKRAGDLQKLVQTKEQESTAALAAAKAENDRLIVGMEFERGLLGVRFKDETAIPKEVRQTFIENAKRGILDRYKPDTIERDGRSMIVFRDAQGMIVNNPDNLQNPFTPGEMLLREIAPLLDQGKAGAGTKPGANGNAAHLAGNWRTKTEAVKAFRDELAARGIAAGTPEHASEMTELYKKHDLSQLPLR